MAHPLGALPQPAVWAGQSVFLTGHTGFKGSWLMAWLEQMGAAVTGFSLPPDTGSLGDRLGHGKAGLGDIRNASALKAAMQKASPLVVLHLAAQALVRHSYVDPLATFATNVMGTAHLLEAVRATPSVQAVVVITTDKCYENREWPWPYRETDALGGHDPYSASKAGSELVTSCWRRSFLAASDVAVASARAGNVIGGGDWSPDRLVPDCVQAFAAGSIVQIRNPRATRPWQHVLDPLCGYLLLAERLLAGEPVAEAWNFGPGMDDVRPVSEVVRILAECWGEDADWAIDGGDHPHEAGLLAVDAAQARVRLGWRPRLPLAEGLRMTAQWYQRHRAGEDARRLVLEDLEHYVGRL
ncbi:MAG: CDP-glucose 4,6-dehydratase [Acidiphilium sp. 34-60-192]|nr:MAG: CDP-glucose 4,6-dehydratase [Acidiphilium sp. 34-60-192]